MKKCSVPWCVEHAAFRLIDQGGQPTKCYCKRHGRFLVRFVEESTGELWTLRTLRQQSAA